MINRPSETNSASISVVVAIVSAYVSRNHVSPAELPKVIASVHKAISGLIAGVAENSDKLGLGKPSPAQIQNSLFRDALISFIDGRPYKTLKRHLTTHGLTPEAYRERFGLPPDYPMVSASYSERRSSLAKVSGLGIRSGRHIANSEVASPSRSRQAAS